MLTTLNDFRKAGVAVLAALILAAGLGGQKAQAADTSLSAESATSFVSALAERAITTLSSTGSSESDRRTAFNALLEDGFELDVIARFVVGRYWAAATPDQQAEYLKLFKNFVLKKYTTLLSTYSGQRFELNRAIEVGARDVIVSTRIVGGGQDPIQADWRVRSYDGRLRIVDIKVEGISMLTSQREEFASILQRSGFTGLIDVLRAESQIQAFMDLPSTPRKAI
ncbi:MAG: hypothetical protein GC199_10645 [Alphaproteobacteria bacterium]|nr:hypothetical protein [Alphaproteobacteria bacterium]